MSNTAGSPGPYTTGIKTPWLTPSHQVSHLPDSSGRWSSTFRPFHLEIENTLSSVDGGTRLATIFRGESRGFFKLAEPVIVRLTKKQFETATENLKALIEAEGR